MINLEIYSEGELVDTYGGDFTYRDIYYNIINGEYIFYERYFGAKPSELQEIDDKEEIEELLKDLKK